MPICSINFELELDDGKYQIMPKDNLAPGIIQ